MLVYYPYFLDRLAQQLLSTDDRMKLVSNTDMLCADLVGANYTYLDISDGINLEVVKATGCEDGCVLIERDQLGTGAFAFGVADTCVTFSNKLPTMRDIICDILANVEDECGSTPWICNVKGDDDYITVSQDPENPCGVIITFDPGTPQEYNLCANPDFEGTLQDQYKMAICVNGETYMVELIDLCNYILAKLGTTPDYVETLIPGDGIDITGTGGTRTISLEPIFGGAKNLTGGAQVNKYGQFTVIPANWPFTTASLTNGVYTNANITVSGGVITAISSGVGGGGINSITTPVAGGLLKGGPPSDPTLSILDTGVTPQTIGPFVVNAKGQITQILSGYTLYKDITGTSPIDVTPAAGNAVVSHETSGITPGVYSGITFDDNGHATDAKGRTAQWVGTATPYADQRISELTTTNPGAGVVQFTFDTPFADADYQVVVTADVAGITYTVSGRSVNGFTINFGAQTNTFYVTAILC